MDAQVPALPLSLTLGMIGEFITMKVGIFTIFTIVTSTILAAGGIHFTLNYRWSQKFPLADHKHLQIPLRVLPDNTTKTHFFHPPLRTQGRDIVDAKDRRLKLASVNWYGASDEQFIPGVWRYAIGLILRK